MKIWKILAGLVLALGLSSPALGQQASGTVSTTAQSVSAASREAGTVVVDASGSWSAAGILVQGRAGNGAWTTLNVYAINSCTALASNQIVSNGLYWAGTAGMTEVQVVPQSNLTGTAAIVLSLSPAKARDCVTLDGSGLAQEAGGNLEATATSAAAIQALLEGSAIQVVGRSSMTDDAADDIIAAQGSGFGIAVMACLVTNADADTSTIVELRDGTTVKWQGYAKATGGGFMATGGGLPMFVTADNAALTARAATTGATIDVSCSGYKVTL